MFKYYPPKDIIVTFPPTVPKKDVIVFSFWVHSTRLQGENTAQPSIKPTT